MRPSYRCCGGRNEATKVALKAVAPHIRPGIRQSEATELIRLAQEAAGLSRIWVLCLFGPNAAFPHGTAEDRVLREGEVVLVDTGGNLHGYSSDISRSWVVGKASARLREIWNTVLAAQSAALEKIRPGVRCAEVDATARAVMAKAGFGGGYEHFTHRLGHGIGREVHEEPYLVPENELILEPGDDDVQRARDLLAWAIRGSHRRHRRGAKGRWARSLRSARPLIGGALRLRKNGERRRHSPASGVQALSGVEA